MQLDEFLIKYGLVLAKRRSLIDKKRFLKAIVDDFSPFTYDVQAVQEKKRFLTTLNIHIGNLTQAKTIIVTPYDQPVKRLFSKGYHPFRSVDKISTKLLAENIALFVFVVLGILTLFLIGPVNKTLSYSVLIALTLLMVLSMILFPQGWLNTANMNRSNAGVYVIYKLAEKLKGNKDTAFVLLDHSDFNHHGELMLSSIIEKKGFKARVIYLDCVGKGDTLIISSNENNQHLAKLFSRTKINLRVETKTYDENTIKASALSRFEKSINLSVGTLVNKQFVIEDVKTSNDLEVKQEVVDDVVKLLYERMTQNE